MRARSDQPEVRNPILTLPSYRKLHGLIHELPAEQRRELLNLVQELAIDCKARGEKAWAKSKPPMAAYWAAMGTWFKHIRAALNKTPAAVAALDLPETTP